MYLPPKGWSGLRLAAMFCLFCAAARADEFVTINFPMNGEKLVAEGLSAPPRQVAAPDGKGYAEVWLRPIRKSYRIFLTFIFEEDGGKGPSVFWSGDVSGKQVTITDNLAEGVVGLNRRTIELPDEIASEAGHLYITGQQDRLLRLRIDWCEPSQSFVASDQERPELVMGGALKLDRELTGQAQMTPPDVWFGRVLDAALQDGVADLSQNTELVVPLKGVLGDARLRAKFLGLPLGRSVRVWINGKVAGRIQPALPSLTDPGYVRRGKRATYAGWREGAIFVEPGSLREGENSILLESPGKGVYLSGAALEIQASTVEKTDPEETETPADSPELAPKDKDKGGSDTKAVTPPPAPLSTPTPSPTPAAVSVSTP